MFEQVVSAPHWTIVHFVFTEIQGGEEKKQNSHYKRTRSAGVIGIFGSVWFQGPSELRWNEACKTRASDWQERLPSRSPLRSFSSPFCVSLLLYSPFSCITLLTFSLAYFLSLFICFTSPTFNPFFCLLWYVFIIISFLSFCILTGHDTASPCETQKPPRHPLPSNDSSLIGQV